MAESPVVYNLDSGTGNSGGGCGNGMWGNDGGWWVIILFALIFGWGRGWGGNDNGGGNSMAYIPYLASSVNASGALTRADLCQDMNFQSLENGVRGIQQGLCDGFYAMNTGIMQGFHGVDNAICTLGYNNAQLANNLSTAMMQGFNAVQAQAAQCCCDNRVGQMQIGTQVERGFCDTNYNASTNTTAIIQNAHNDTDRVIARLDAMEAARKDEVIADLRSKLAACGDQTTAQYIINQLTGVISPRAVPAYPAASPCGLGNWAPQVLANGYYGYGNGGCGCNSGCGC